MQLLALNLIEVVLKCLCFVKTLNHEFFYKASLIEQMLCQLKLIDGVNHELLFPKQDFAMCGDALNFN